MKKVSLPLLLIFSFTLFAQDEDYCPCQEAQAQEAEIFEYFTSINTQIAVFVPQESNLTLVPETIQQQEPITIIFPEEEKVEVVQEIKEDIPEKEVMEKEPEEIKERMEAREAVRSNSIKKYKKRKRFKLKRKKRTKKYKGSCPFF